MHKVKSNFNFGIWISVFFTLIFSVPILTFFGFLDIAKLVGVVCLILVLVALRIWLRISQSKSGKIRRISLNNNQIFDLERKYFFLKNLKKSTKKTIFERSGIILAEIVPYNRELSSEQLIDFAFNVAIFLLDKQQVNYIESKINFNSDHLNILTDFLNWSDLSTNKEYAVFENYKIALNQSVFARKLENIIFS
jgi:hypothetical protein